MTGELQHCPACDEEYVAGIPSCVECGGALEPGPLPRLERAERGRRAPAAATGDRGAVADHRLAELPGQEADHLVRALVMEGIACRVECGGIVKQYAAGQPPAEPFAITLPVTILVAGTQREAAEDLLGSMQEEDVIGEQWDAEPDRDGDFSDEPASPSADEEYEHLPMADAAPPAAYPAPQSQGTSLRTIAVLVAIGLVLLFLFAR